MKNDPARGTNANAPRGGARLRRDDALARGLADRPVPQRPARAGRVEVDVVRAQGRDLRDVRIEHADSGLGARARAVPGGAVARDLDLGLVGYLRCRVIAELALPRVEADRGAALAVVAEPDVALVIRLRVVRTRQVERQLVLVRARGFRVDVAND